MLLRLDRWGMSVQGVQDIALHLGDRVTVLRMCRSNNLVPMGDVGLRRRESVDREGW